MRNRTSIILTTLQRMSKKAQLKQSLTVSGPSVVWVLTKLEIVTGKIQTQNSGHACLATAKTDPY